MPLTKERLVCATDLSCHRYVLISHCSSRCCWRSAELLSAKGCAHAGSDNAVTQLEAGKQIFDIAGYVSFLLWRSVYITKQVSG